MREKKSAALLSLLVLAAFGLSGGSAIGDDSSGLQANQRRLNEILTILQQNVSATGRKCVSSLQEMHATEDQVSQLQNQVGDAPTASQTHDDQQDALSIARDVLSSDVDNAIVACGADAKTICPGVTQAAAIKACAHLSEQVAPDQPGR